VLPIETSVVRACGREAGITKLRSLWQLSQLYGKRPGRLTSRGHCASAHRAVGPLRRASRCVPDVSLALVGASHGL